MGHAGHVLQVVLLQTLLHIFNLLAAGAQVCFQHTAKAELNNLSDFIQRSNINQAIYLSYLAGTLCIVFTCRLGLDLLERQPFLQHAV